jgi:hypothetical protein
MYAINTANGGLKWKFETKDPLAYWDNNMSAIGGSPCYDNGKIFFNDINRKTYCLDAVTGAEIWEWITPWTSIASNANEVFHFGTPTVGGGRVYTGAGIQYQGLHFVALNETTGELIWNRSMGGNTQPVNTPAYQYVSPSDERIYFCESLSISCYNAANGHLLWLQFNGHQNFASPVFVNSLRGPVVYVGSDTYGISCYNATITTDRYDRFGALIAEASGGNGTTISTFDTEGEIDGSAALYDGMLYIGSADGKLYCLSDIPDVCLYMDAASSKGAGPMWSNETMTITGRLYTITTYTHYNQPGQPTDDYYVGIPYEDVLVTFTKPDGTSVDVPATTDNYGYFSVSYNPNAEGQWSWNAWFNGKDNVRDQLLYAYTEEAPVTVATPPTGGGGGGGGSAGTPVEYIYVAIAVIVIVLIAIGVYVFMRRRK